MKRTTFTFLFLLVLAAGAITAGTANAQQHGTAVPTTTLPPSTTTPQQTATRDATREKVRAVLIAMAPKTNIDFKLSEKQPYNFVGVLKTGLKNADALEVVISVSAQDTIHFRIYPHYNGAYVNVDKVQDGAGLARQIIRFSDSNFLFWGADNSYDVFAGYNFTLESGFPEASFRIVLSSIGKLDDYVGQLRPVIDGSAAQ
jgi:hypothetical protein